MKKKLVLILNCGSSSIKFALIDPIKEKKELYGLAECLKSKKPKIKWKIKKEKNKFYMRENESHKEALKFIIYKIIKNNKNLKDSIFSIGHRIVHGGERFIKSTIINNDVIDNIEKCSLFAPLHNPAGIIGIKESIKNLPKLKNKNVAVFDTSFHQTMPYKAYLYALPYYFYKKYGIRRYGAHGTSHKYITIKSSELFKKPISKINIISCHLGNGSSISAIVNGKSVDTSMGFTPLEGLIMGTRSGDIDPAIIFYLYKKLNMNIEEIESILNEKSGILALSKKTNDLRYSEENFHKNPYAKKTIKIYCYKLSKYISSYFPSMKNGIDAIIFTGGIGENSALIQKITLKQLKIHGILYKKNKNYDNSRKKIRKISSKKSKIPVWVIPTNEELLIAKDTYSLTS